MGQSLDAPDLGNRLSPHSEIFFLGDDVLDLFGNPSRDRKGQRGRPSYEVTERNRNKVKLLLALGWSNDRIASAIEASLATLKRYFRAELKVRDQMRDRMDAERMLRLAEEAGKGNVGAHRELSKQIDRNDRMEIERELASKPKAAEKIGKKEFDARVARDADADLMAELEQESGAARH